jgi:hypothetical protein
VLTTRRFVLCIAACSLFAARPALAQTPSGGTQDVRSTARLHYGPFYATPRFSVKEFGVDSNVFNRSGEQTPDFTMVLAPGITGWVPFTRRVLLTAQTGVDVIYFRKYANQRSFDPQVSLRGQLFVRRLTLTGEAGYVRARQRIDQDLDARVRRSIGTLMGQVELALSPKMTLSLATKGADTYVREGETFGGVDLHDSLNTTTQTLTGEVRYSATPYTTLVGRVERERARFPFSEAKNADSLRVAPGVQFNPRAVISGSGFFGFRRFTPRSPLVPAYSGPTASINLAYTLLGATRFSVSWLRDTAFSYEPVNPYSLNDETGFGIRRQLVGHFDASFDVKRYRAAYRQTGPVLLGPARVDTTSSIASSLGYRLSRDTRVGFGVTYWRRSSNTRLDREYRGFRAGVLFSYGL